MTVRWTGPVGNYVRQVGATMVPDHTGDGSALAVVALPGTEVVRIMAAGDPDGLGGVFVDVVVADLMAALGAQLWRELGRRTVAAGAGDERP